MYVFGILMITYSLFGLGDAERRNGRELIRGGHCQTVEASQVKVLNWFFLCTFLAILAPFPFCN